MKVLKTLSALAISATMIFSVAALNVSAATTTQDGLEVSFTTDKETYSKDEKITATLSVKNTNESDVTDVAIETIIPDGYEVTDGSKNNKQIDKLAPNESAELKVVYVAKDSGGNSQNSEIDTVNPNDNTPNTGDSVIVPIAAVLVMLIFALFTVLCFKSKKGRKLLSIILTISIVGGTSTLITVKANAAEDSKTIRIETSVMVNGKLMNIEGSVKYQYSTNDNSGTQNSTNVIYSPNPENIVTDTTEGISFVNNMVIIVFSDTANNLDINNVIESINGKVVGKIDTINQYQVQIAEKSLDELKKTIEIIEKNDCVLFAHYDQAYQNIECATSVDDPWDGDVDGNDWLDADVDGSNWWLETIEAPSAWDYNDQLDKIKIGIVDNGFDTGHEDLVVTFPDEFGKLNRREDHGTHVAGIIGATANNKKGISGIVWNKDLICFDWQPTSLQDKLLNWTVDTMIYAGLIFEVEAGAKVVNFSLGCAGNYPNGNTYSQNVIDNSGKEASGYMAVLLKNYDFIVVQAAGNGGVDAINALHFASITPNNCVNWGRGRANRQNILDRILIVAAVEQSTQSQTGYMVSSFSDGGNQVNIAAPGGDNSGNNDRDIYSTVTGGFKGKYKSMAGTSMAAPIVTGVASLTWAANSDLNGSEVVKIVCENTSIHAIDNPQSTTTGDFNIVNAKLAVEEALKRKRTYVSGTVKDENGNILNDVKVSLNDNEGNTYGNKFTENGQYSFEVDFKNGRTYTATFEKTGYQTISITETDGGTNIQINAELKKSSDIEYSIPEDVLKYNGHSYYIYSDVANTWEEAKEYCESLGGYLAVINDEAENTALYNYMTSCGYQSAYFGYSDSETEGVWKWVSNDTSNYTNWASGEPNQERTTEDYAMFYLKYTDGKWNDGDFNGRTVQDTSAFICEWNEENENDWNDYVSLLNEFVSSGKWAKLSETEIKDTNSVFSDEIISYNDISNPEDWSINEESKHIFDMDGDGIPEMLLSIEHNEWRGPSGAATNTELVTIKDGKAKIIMNAYWTGGSMRGDSISVCKNNTDNRYYVAYNSHMRIDEGNHRVSTTYYNYSGGDVSEVHNIRKNQSYNWSSGNSVPDITYSIDGNEASETEYDKISNSFYTITYEDFPNYVTE